MSITKTSRKEKIANLERKIKLCETFKEKSENQSHYGNLIEKYSSEIKRTKANFDLLKKLDKTIMPAILVILILVVLFFLKPAFIGYFVLDIDPSHVDLIFEPGLEKTIQLNVINNVHKDFDAVVYAEGALAEYITIDEQMIKLTKDQDSKIISYKINLPQSLEKQGLHEARIIVREIPKTTKGETMITANFAIVSKLNVMVPYNGKYTEIKLFVTDFKQNKESNFAVEVRNLGTEDILEAKAIIDIYGPLNDKLTTVTSNKASVKSKDKEILIVKWTPKLGPGDYYAVATLIYDELNTKDEKSFTIGTIGVEEEEKPAVLNSVYILIFLVVILIIFNVIIYFKKVRK